MDYRYFMEYAYNLGKKALKYNDIPIGCVIVFENNIIGYGFNKRNLSKNVLYHAEIIAINMACKHMKDWRLEECTLFVTVEPCAMCAGAILQSRIKRVVFGVENKKGGACGSVVNLLNQNKFNHQVEVISNYMLEDCSSLMSSFFKKLRS